MAWRDGLSHRAGRGIVPTGRGERIASSCGICRSGGALRCGADMEQILMNLIAGAIGGNAAGKASPSFDLGTIGNTISGIVGGGVLGQLIPIVLPAISAAAQGGNLSIGGILTNLIAGGAGGAVLTAIIGALKNKAA